MEKWYNSYVIEKNSTEDVKLSSCGQSTGSYLFVSIDATGTPVHKFICDSCSETYFFDLFGRTTGTYFQINILGNCIKRSVFSSVGYVESILNFIDIVNNKDGWLFLQRM